MSCGPTPVAPLLVLLTGCNLLFPYGSLATRVDGAVVEPGDAEIDHRSPAADAARADSRRPDLMAVSAGGWHSCALRRGSVFCWGSNKGGKLGDGPLVDSVLPVQVVGLTDAVAVAASKQHTCALRSSGVVVCWGDNSGYQLGVEGGSSAVPVEPALPEPAVAVAGGWDHTCALLASGQVSCWGLNDHGECGDDNIGTPSTTPGLVKNLSDALELDSGNDFVCARRGNGRVACWGSLDGSTLSAAALPADVPALTDAVEIGTGDDHACAVRAGGQVVCWGNNAGGQLGIAPTTTASTTPVAVAGLGEIEEIVAGLDRSCARHADGRVSCWGWNGSGALGRGLPETTLLSTHTPDEVVGLAAAVQLSATEGHTCALTAAGEAVCWGDNSAGQLGDGTTTDSSSVVQVKGLP